MEEQALQEGWQMVSVDAKIEFKVPENLKFIKKIGSGAFGIAASFSKPDGFKIVVQKFTHAFDDIYDAKNSLQEIRLMRKFKHPNLLAIQDLYPPDSATFDDIYVVSEFMDSDLHRVIMSKQRLTEEHHQYFCCQILFGLRYLHAAKVVHYDLKPSNLFVNKNCDLKISGFRKARRVGPNTIDDNSEFVVCRWYRAPEFMLLSSECSSSIDMWSVGCILCDLIGRKPIFAGRDALDQVKKIIRIVGSPSEADLDWLPLKGPARSFIRKIENSSKQAWSAVYPQVSASSHEALEAMLTFHPHHRIDAAAALQLPYFEEVYEQSHFVVNCHESGSEHVQCTTLGGSLIGTFSVPEDEETFDSWLAHKVVEAKPGIEGTLSMVNQVGEVFYTQHFEVGSEPINEPIDWIDDTTCLTKRQMQNDVYRECWKFRPWIAERDKQQLQDLGIALSGDEHS